MMLKRRTDPIFEHTGFGQYCQDWCRVRVVRLVDGWQRRAMQVLHLTNSLPAPFHC